jgi:hypothetical protein
VREQIEELVTSYEAVKNSLEEIAQQQGVEELAVLPGALTT